MLRSALPIGLALAAAGCAAPPPPTPIAPVASVAPPASPPCRGFTAQALIDGKMQPIAGHACLQPDGTWRVAEGPPGQPPMWTVVYPPPPPDAWYAYGPAWWREPWFDFGLATDIVVNQHPGHFFHGHMHAGLHPGGGMRHG